MNVLRVKTKRENTLEQNSIEDVWNYTKHLNIAKHINPTQTSPPVHLYI